jgi:hypothetical protein
MSRDVLKDATEAVSAAELTTRRAEDYFSWAKGTTKLTLIKEAREYMVKAQNNLIAAANAPDETLSDEHNL